jgi:regulator of sigma E protease
MNALLAYLPTVITFVAVLAILVLAHEAGHYLAARFFKIDVEEFGIGFPPRLTGWKRGTMTWSINWIPLGGFVKIKGENESGHHEPGSFGSKPAYARGLVIAAGVLMNLVLATVMFTAAFALGTPQLAEDLPANVHARDYRVQIIEVLPKSPAEKAGIYVGDIIDKLDGTTYATVTEIQDHVNASATDGVVAVIRRGNTIFTRAIVPQLDPTSGRRLMGVALVETALVSYPIHVAAWKGIQATGFYLKEIILTAWDLIKSLFVAQKTAVEFSGPVGIAVLTGRMAKLGLASLLQFIGLLSVNLAVVNFLPIPALDGGRFLFIVVERLRGRAIRPKLEAWMQAISFYLLLALVLLVTLQDLGRYRDQIFSVIKSVFGMS